MLKHPGPTATLIDAGFVAKMPWCKFVDATWGINLFHPLSLERGLRIAYRLWRPWFVFTDTLLGCR